MITWRVKKGQDRRVRGGHPWVFAGELNGSAKEVRAGELVELRDERGNFLAYGYGHPSSQIAFRKLSSREKESDVMSVEFFRRRLAAARALRVEAGWTEVSHRWLFAEADGVPGLIVDAFRAGGRWMVVVQASTAGADRALPDVFAAIRSFAGEFDGELTVINAPSSRARVAEGLSVGEKHVVHGEPASLEDVSIDLIDGLKLRTDLLRGQKTGFFLDQQWNATVMKQLLRRQYPRGAPRALRVLDVCCYVGQWSAHATKALAALGHEVEVALVDISSAALAFAEANVRAAGATRVQRVEGDALSALGSEGLAPASFDVVICDPPAFVKKKADLEPGLRAYVKLNRDALKLAKPGALFVASSCSGLVKSADYQRVMAEASAKAGRVFKQVATGGHGPDHPVRPEFPEGEYLKCTFGRVEYPY